MGIVLVTKFLSSDIIDIPYNFSFMRIKLHYKLDFKKRRKKLLYIYS